MPTGRVHRVRAAVDRPKGLDAALPGLQPTAAKLKKPRPLLNEMHTWWGNPASVLDPNERALIVQIGIYIPNPMNPGKNSTAWRAVYGKRKQVRTKTMHALARFEIAELTRFLGGWPTRVTMTRCSTRKLDKGAEWAALKSVQDQVAAWLAGDNTPKGKGDDGPKSGIDWRCAQQIDKAHGVLIEIARNV